MSTQRKKKISSSRRRLGNQHNTFMEDTLGVSESIDVAEDNSPNEENKSLSNSDDSQCAETAGKNSSSQIHKTECNIEQQTFSLPTDGNQNEKLSLHMDSHPQDSSVNTEEQSDTNFNPAVNRRKLGSSRRNKRRQHVEDPVAESLHETKEEVVENISGYKAFDTTKMSSRVELAVKKASVETAVEGSDKSDKEQTEKLSGQVNESGHLVDLSEFSSSTLHAPILSNQQLIKHSLVTETPYDLCEHLHLVEESDVKSTDLESPMKPVCTEKSDLGQHADPEGGVERATALSRKEELSTNEEQNEHFSLSTIRGAEMIMHEKEVKPTEMQEIHPAEYPFESMVQDTAENSETCSANPSGQDRSSDSYQSESSEKSIDHCAIKEGDSNLDGNQAEHHTKESNIVVTDQINDDSHVYDLNEPSTSDTERGETALSLEYEDGGYLEDNKTLINEHASHQEEESLLSERISPPQTLQSETNLTCDSQPLDNSVNIDKQGDSGERQESVKGYETEMSFTMETAVQEMSEEIVLEGVDKSEVHELKENAQVSTSEFTSIRVRSSPPVHHRTVDQSNSIQMPEELPSMFSIPDTQSKETNEDTDLLRQWGLLTSNYLVNETDINSEDVESSITPEITTGRINSGESIETKCKVEQTIQSDQLSVFEVIGAQPSEEDAAKHSTAQEEDVQATQMHPTNNYSDMDKKSPQVTQSEIPLAHRRKLGSSRRNKRRQHDSDSVPEQYPEPKDAVESTCGDQVSKQEKMPLETGSVRQEEIKEPFDPDFKPNEKMRKIRSVNEEDNREWMLAEDTTLPQSVMDSNMAIPTNITSSLEKGDSLDLTPQTPVTPCSKIGTMDVIQSTDTSLWKADSDAQDVQSSRLVTSDVLDQGEAVRVHNKDTSVGHDVHVQQTNHGKETVGDVTIKVCSAESEHLADVQKDDSWALSDIGQQENLKAKPNINVSGESGVSAAMDASNNQYDVQMTLNVNKSKNGTRRKMGSTRRSQLNRKQENEMDDRDEIKRGKSDMEADVRNTDMMMVEELSLTATGISQIENTHLSLSTVYEPQQEMTISSSVHEEEKRHQSSTSDLEASQSNMIPGTDDSVALPPEQPDSQSDKVVHPVEFAERAVVSDSEGNQDISVELPTAVLTGRLNQLPPPNTDGATNMESCIAVSFGEFAQSTQDDEQSPEGIKVTQDTGSELPPVLAVDVAELEAVQSLDRGGAAKQYENTHACLQEPNNVTEEAHSTDSEMKNAGSNVSPTHRRRKMGSTRRNLGSRSKWENPQQKQEVDKEATATNVEDVWTESVSGIIEKEPKLHHHHKDSDSTVEFSHAAESQLKHLALQTVEENPDSPSHPAETEHNLPPDRLAAEPSASHQDEVLSESASGGRRRKMGSHRKSHGHQNAKDQTTGEDRTIDTQKESDGRSLTIENIIKTSEDHREEESSGPDKISEVESDKRPTSNISISKPAEQSGPLSDSTPKQVASGQTPHADIHLEQGSQTGDSTGADVRSKSYSVLLVGNTYVGKTSFTRRAHSGKFSFDIPSSVGLDSCMWTVVVDGKPMVLQLWDTAGQERFHSITRQIFHKAEAFILMYDITSSQSFSAVSYWANCIQEGTVENVPVLLLGNKSDCKERQVKTQEGEILAKEYNYDFIECSAATGENVIHSLETVARMLRQKIDTRKEAVALHKEPPKKRSGCC